MNNGKINFIKVVFPLFLLMKYLKGSRMNFVQIFKNYLFSSNWNLINPSYRFAPVFYKRLIIDFLLRLFIFLPFSIFFVYLVQNGYFKEVVDTMLQAGQNAYGYLLVIFVYIPVALFLIYSLIASLLGSILKRNIFIMDNQPEEISVLPENYTEAFLSAWKNLWYFTIETFVILFITKFIIELIAIHTVTFAIMPVLKSLLITVATSAVLALVISLPWLFSKKKVAKKESNDNDRVMG